MLQRAIVAVLAAACALVVAAPASAATVVVGQTQFPDDGLLIGCDATVCNTVLTQLVLPAGGARVTAPADGVIKSWRVHGDTSGDGRLRLRVLRPTPTGAFRAAGQSLPVLAGKVDGSPPHATDVPIAIGDYIGVETSLPTAGSSADQHAYVFERNVTGAKTGWWDSGFADNTSPDMTLDDTLMPLGATVQLAVPTVSGLGTARGSTEGGDTVAITGRHLANASRVVFGGTPGTITSNSNSRIEAIAPQHSAGPFHVRVTTIGGDSPAGAPSRYTFVSPGGPSIELLKLQPRAFRAGAGGGTRVLIRVSEVVTTRFTVQRAKRGVTRRGRCVKGRARRRSKRCTRYVAQGGFSRQSPAGSTTFRFAGRLGGKKLAPGSYRLVARGTNAVGQRTKPKRRKFRVKR